MVSIMSYPVQCSLCGKICRTAQGLRGHLNFKHGMCRQTESVKRIGQAINAVKMAPAKIGIATYPKSLQQPDTPPQEIPKPNFEFINKPIEPKKYIADFKFINKPITEDE